MGIGAQGLNPSYSLLSAEREQLTNWQEQIKTYLRDELRLELNDKRTRLRPASDGIDFVGYITRREYLLLRRRVVSKLKVKLRIQKGTGSRGPVFSALPF